MAVAHGERVGGEPRHGHRGQAAAGGAGRQPALGAAATRGAAAHRQRAAFRVVPALLPARQGAGGRGHQGGYLPDRARAAAGEYPAATGGRARDAREHHHRRGLDLRPDARRAGAAAGTADGGARSVRRADHARTGRPRAARRRAVRARYLFVRARQHHRPADPAPGLRGPAAHPSGRLEQPRAGAAFRERGRGARAGLHRREGNRPGQRARARGGRLHQPPAHRHAAAVRSVGDLRHPQLRWQHPQERPAS